MYNNASTYGGYLRLSARDRKWAEVLLILIVLLAALPVLRQMGSLFGAVFSPISVKPSNDLSGFLQVSSNEVQRQFSSLKDARIFQSLQLSPQEEKAVAAEAWDHFQLIGLISGNRPEAVLKDASTGQSFIIHQGDVVMKYRVKSIQSDSILLTFEKKEKTIVL